MKRVRAYDLAGSTPSPGPVLPFSADPAPMLFTSGLRHSFFDIEGSFIPDLQAL